MKTVYVASAGARRQKVGISSNPRRRLSELRIMGRKVVMVGEQAVVDAVAVERMAHWILRASHIYGEWFAVSPQAAIRAVAEAVALVGAGHAAPSRIAGAGRPALGIVSTTVRLPKLLLDRIDALRGPGRRAEFIREAVEAELARAERKAK